MNQKSLLVLCLFGIVLLGLVIAEDYEDGEGDDDGGDYDSDGDQEGQGDAWPYAAAAGAAAAASQEQPVYDQLNRKKRSANIGDDSQRVLRRVRRGGHGRVGKVYTYQKTDHKAHFKWGVKHNVGKGYGK